MTNLATEFFPPDSGPLANLTKSIAVLRLNPEELSERIGIPFQVAHDDLDILDWARVIGVSGRPYALVRHRHTPEPGTQIVVPHDSRDPRADVLDVLSGLKLSQRDLVWTSQEAVPSSKRQSTRAVRRTPQKKSSRKMLLKVPAKLTKRLRNVQGRGRFHTLLRAFQKRVNGTELEVTPRDVEKLLGYSADLGTSPSRSPVSHRKATKKAARKK
jgi:hypothetical protein